MEWKVAPSYQHMTVEKIDEDAHKAYVTEKCWKCGGSGNFAWFGACFACDGTGKNAKWVKIYSPAEYEKYLTSQEKSKAKKEQAAAERKRQLLDNSEANKKALLAQFGYNSDSPFVYIVVGEDTYNIKDELKNAGARFERSLGWYTASPIEVPEGYSQIAIPFDEVYDWNPLTKKISIKEEATEIVEKIQNENKPESASEYIGEIKERVRDLEVTVVGSRSIDGAYGTSNIYTFKEHENIIVWFTTSYQEINVGDELLLTGTVKSHDEYKGVKQTKMTRCILKKRCA